MLLKVDRKRESPLVIVLSALVIAGGIWWVAANDVQISLASIIATGLVWTFAIVRVRRVRRMQRKGGT